jgi:hypothetical protein
MEEGGTAPSLPGGDRALGLVPHLQVQLLARHLRSDLDAYPPCSGNDPLSGGPKTDREVVMLVLVTYDVSTVVPGRMAPLRRVAKACRDFGQRAQFSVFEIEVDPAQWATRRRSWND